MEKIVFTWNYKYCSVRSALYGFGHIRVRNVYKVHDPNYYRNEATKSLVVFVQFAPPLNIQHLM